MSNSVMKTRQIFNALCPIKGGRYYHADSRMQHQIENLRPLDPAMVNFGPDLSVNEILDKLPGVAIFGQVPPTDVLWNGTPDEVRETAIRNIKDVYATRKGRIVVSSAGSVNPGTPLENLKALMEAPLEYERNR